MTMLFEPELALTDRPSVIEAFRNDVLAGLATRPRAIPARWFYDEPGCRLFDAITELPEYYLTRNETALLERHASAIATLAGPIGTLVEFGSGSATKTPLLLRAIDPSTYVPIDIAGETLNDSAATLGTAFPRLDIVPLEGDFMAPMALPPSAHPRRFGFFPGSTIGNFDPATAVDLLRNFATMLGEGSLLLIGMDRVKEGRELLSAYDDPAGVTASFNRNLVERINRELEGDIPINNFRHHAVWNERASRIEMHLEAIADCHFSVARRNFSIAGGETIHTENSYKFGLRDAHMLLHAGTWSPLAEWVDPEARFMLILARATARITAP